MTISDIFLWLAAADLALGAAMIACVFLVANLVPDVDKVSLRTAKLMTAFWTVGPWLLLAAMSSAAIFLALEAIEWAIP